MGGAGLLTGLPFLARRRYRRRCVMQRAALMKFLTRALAVLLVVVAHGFLLNLGHPASTALGIAYAACVVCLAAAAWMLWRRTME